MKAVLRNITAENAGNIPAGIDPCLCWHGRNRAYSCRSHCGSNGLGKSHDQTKAIVNLSFDLGEGEVFGLLGPNGVGETTTISMLTTRLRPSTGDAMLFGHSVSNEPKVIRQMIGVAPQEVAIGKLLGLKLSTPADCRATVEFEDTERHANPMGTLHGGVLCDIADAAMGTAYRGKLKEDEAFTTLELKLNFLRPMWKATLRAEAGIVRARTIVGLVECNTVGEQERLRACVCSTCYDATRRARPRTRLPPRIDW